MRWLQRQVLLPMRLCLTVAGAVAAAARGGGNGGAGMLDVGAALGRMLDRRVDAALHCSLPLARCLRDGRMLSGRTGC